MGPQGGAAGRPCLECVAVNIRTVPHHSRSTPCSLGLCALKNLMRGCPRVPQDHRERKPRLHTVRGAVPVAANVCQRIEFRRAALHKQQRGGGKRECTVTRSAAGPRGVEGHEPSSSDLGGGNVTCVGATEWGGIRVRRDSNQRPAGAPCGGINGTECGLQMQTLPFSQAT